MTNDPRKSTSEFRQETLIWQTRVETKLDTALKIQDDHSKELWGVNGMPGLSKTVDRLVQSEKNRRTLAGSVVAIVAGLVGETVWRKFTGH